LEEILNHHVPVLIDSIIENMNFDAFNNEILIVDCCFGEGGYTDRFLEAQERIKVFGIEQDKTIYDNVVKKYEHQRVEIFNDNFINISKIFVNNEKNFANYFVFDLGISMFHIRESELGISFMRDQPLDMRMSKLSTESAEDIINSYTQQQLADIFYKYGEEHRSYAVAKKIFEERRKKRITTTKQLADIVLEVYGGRKGRNHPATKVFQALRIKVNNELDNLEEALKESFRRTIINGRVFVVSYHSLEDRIVKNFFRELEDSGYGKRVTKKPIVPEYEEISKNNAARSAKLRIIEKVKI